MVELAGSTLRRIGDPAATAVALFIAIVAWNVWGYVANRIWPPSTRDPSDVAVSFLGMGITWGITLLLLLIVLFWEQAGLESIGIGRPMLSHVWWGLAGFILGGAIFLLTKPVMAALGLADVQESGIAATELTAWPLSIALPGILTNAFTEEIVLRGYIIERFASVTSRMLIAALVSWLAFTIGHLFSYGFGAMLQIGLWTIVVTALYVSQRSVWPCIVMHAVNNFAGLVVLPRLAGR